MCVCVCTQCDEFIQKYGEEIINLLVSKVAAKEICVILGVCVAEKHGFPVMAGRSNKFSPHHEEIDKCSVCEFVIELVKDILQQNLTEVRTCSSLPPSLSLSLSPSIRTLLNLKDTSINRTGIQNATFVYLTTSVRRTPHYSGHFNLA